MLQLLIKKIENHLKANPTERGNASAWMKDEHMHNQKQALIDDIYLLINYLDAARLFYYTNQNKAATRPSWFEEINRLSKVIFNNQLDDKYWKGDKVLAKTHNPPAANPVQNNTIIEAPSSPVYVAMNYVLMNMYTSLALALNTIQNTAIQNNQQQTAILQNIQEQTNQSKQKQDELNAQEAKIKDNISLQELIQSRKTLKELLKELGTSYEAEANKTHSSYYYESLNNFNAINKGFTEEKRKNYENARAANRNSLAAEMLSAANSAFAFGMLSAYMAGSIGTAFYFITFEYNKDLLRLEKFNEIALNLARDGKDFGLTFANWLFFVWNIIDAIGVLIDGLNDAYNGDYGWSLINILNGAQLIAATLIGHHLYENAASTGAQFAGLTLASGAFALCMFLCSYVAKRKELEAINFVAKLAGKSDTDFLYELTDEEDKKALINKIDTIRRTRSDEKYSHILTCDLTVQQAKAILQTEALYQNKSKVSWFSCGVTMSLVFTSSAIAAMGASEIAILTAVAGFITTGGVAAPIIATLIIIGLIINCIDRYQLRQADKLANEITNDIVSDNGIKDSNNFYTNINSAYTGKNTWSYWSNPLDGKGMARKLGVEKVSLNETEMIGLNLSQKYKCAI